MQHDEFDIFDKQYWSVGQVLRKQGESRSDSTFLRFESADGITYGQADIAANRIANGLISVGVRKSDRVAVLLPNCVEYCYAWFGISRTGAVHVAVNTEYKGVFLRHVLANSRASVLICTAEYVPRIQELEGQLPHLTTLIVTGGANDYCMQLNKQLNTQVNSLAFEGFYSESGDPVNIDVSYRDLGCIMYTSGTTGPSKGVLMPHAHNYVFGLGSVEKLKLTSDDVYYIALPLYHANGMFMQLYATLIAGATAVVKTRFSASSWITDIKRYRVSVTNTLGVMNEFLLSQPQNADDKSHRLRTIAVAPNTPTLEANLKQRFNVQNVVGLYGMTEVNIPLFTDPSVAKPGSCGKEYSRYFEVKIVDPETDEEQVPGQVGEIVVRPKQAFAFMAGYNDMEGKTVEAWRNFWFHTGDAATMDEEGYVFFVDRIKDCIRCRGENISSYEIESVILEHNAVAEVAAVAVESDIAGGEDDVKVVVVLKKGGSVMPSELVKFCEEQMPAFAVPRYIDFLEALPKTPTNKVMKNRLREIGVLKTSWDRQVQKKQ